MQRIADIARKTDETNIRMKINIDGKGKNKIDTGIGYFDHMLKAFSVHSGIDMELKAEGDLWVDTHHTVEDTGIVLGKAIKEALGDKKGIMRYGSFFCPMDESLSSCHLDISGRAFLVFDGEFLSERCGEMETQMVEEFFRAIATNAGITLHLTVEYGKNDHHKIESLFKAFAHALRAAVIFNGNSEILSSKGTL